ncbi:MAG TPA: S8 family serine peptidase [Symbiobacteriaceae bacterium]|nr:S8 family serine peptidase [Symbiobacteriaceae bacterium]
MSLGTDSPSDGDDPLSRAANAAADAGLVVVVSAGNTGPDKLTVGAPGAASAAISMAAAQSRKPPARTAGQGAFTVSVRLILRSLPVHCGRRGQHSGLGLRRPLQQKAESAQPHQREEQVSPPRRHRTTSKRAAERGVSKRPRFKVCGPGARRYG